MKSIKNLEVNANGDFAMPKGAIYGHKESAPLKEIDTRGESMNNWENIKVINREGLYKSKYRL